MAIVQNLYTGNGATVLFPFSFDYLDQAHVKVTLNGTASTAFVFANDTTLQFLTAPLAGVAIRIYRETETDSVESTFFPGSAIRATELNDNFTQTLYAVQESNFEANSATTTANTALTNSATAISTANAATSTANTALSNSATAVSTANTASTNASNAVTTANTASSNASTAVTTANAATVTANSAASTAATALSTANTASSNASAAVSTANTASTNASNAVTTANTALSTANTASSNASTAVTTANNAVSTANGAVSTANTALSTANAAISAVASAVIYTPVANLTALAALTPSNGDYFELSDSTGAEGSALITGVTIGLVGAPGLTFRLRYDSPPGIFTFIGYFANDSETRYLKFSGGTLTGQLFGDNSTSASTPGFAFDGDPNTGVLRPGADELALVTGGTSRLTIDSSGNVAVPGGLTRAGNNVVTVGDTGTVTSTMILDGTILNADVNASAAIAGTKISPDFGSQTIATTGVFSHALGAVGTPSITFTGDLNTGIWSPAADTIAFAEGGVETMRIDSSGRVGIGTSSPGRELHISGAGTSGTQLQVQGTSASAGIKFIPSSGDNWEIQTSTASDFLVYNRTDEATRFVINGSGNVGIGATTPNKLCELRSTDAATTLRISNRYAANSGAAVIDFETLYGGVDGAYGYAEIGAVRDGTSTNYMYFKTSGSERARIDSSGRILVGTSTSPSAGNVGQYGFVFNAGNTSGANQAGIFVAARAKAATSITSGEDIGLLTFTDNAGNDFAHIRCQADANAGASDYPGRLVFSTTADGASSPTERMRITQSGTIYQNFSIRRDAVTDFNQSASSADLPVQEYYASNNSYASTAFQITCARSNSSSYSLLSAYSGGSSDREFNLRGDGTGLCDGSWTGGGADYAEYFEWSDNNPDAEDRRGISVVLDGDKMREAVSGEDPIGVISGNPSVVGDSAWNKWSGKYLRDEFNSYLLDENGDRQLNPAFDPHVEYVSREQRPEWDCVGLMGKLRVRKGQVTGSRWIKMRNINDSVEEWLVR